MSLRQDIKTANVLLGRNYAAKIADVGMAQIQRNAGNCLTNAQGLGTFAWSVSVQIDFVPLEGVNCFATFSQTNTDYLPAINLKFRSG